MSVLDINVKSGWHVEEGNRSFLRECSLRGQFTGIMYCLSVTFKCNEHNNKTFH